MREPLTLLKALPRYEIFLEETKHFPELDVSACYTFLQLLRTGDELLAFDELILSGYGIRQGRFNLLMLLKHCPSDHDTPAELAQKTGVTRATISGLLDGLEKDGFIERRTDPQDRRTVQVHLTPAGHTFLDQVRPGYCHWLARIVEPLDQEERQHFVLLLEKIQVRLAELASELSAQPCC
ncbi:MAG: MarR family transcriptional regulator [Ktedonobacteraceae bacterium]|nr:MarR family transcriptional regulator [Verrucomicrobiota bacterium]MBV9674635.1 MarR family transcriptional regulator [Verrucomicrobiota bacterium]MBV9712350.1 MarR family transcriptional regulator [Ktedonobacteraceae bacterium]